jgi:hypothetical protein
MIRFIAAIRKAYVTDVMALVIIIATGALGYALIPMVQP